MKKFVSVVLLFVFLFNAAGYVIAFKMMQAKIKTEVHSKLQGVNTLEQLSVITIADSEFKNIQWFDNGKEIRYKEHMYDIVGFRKTNSGTLFCCFDDTKEKNLFDTFEEYIESNSPIDSILEEEEEDDDDESKKKILNHISKLYILSSHSNELILQSSLNKFCGTNKLYTSTSKAIKDFPPECISCII